jgi:hypothetical protein
MASDWQPALLSTHGNTLAVPALDSLSLVSRKLLQEKAGEISYKPIEGRPYDDKFSVGLRLDQKRKASSKQDNRNTAPRIEKDSMGYQQYRVRQRRDAANEGDSVWPDELEEAFQEGLSHFIN